MISVSEYARNRGITRESVNKQIRKRPEELEGHIFPKGRSFDLDDIAVEYLDEHRQPRVITLEPLNEEIQAEMNQLREALKTAQEELAKSQARVIALQEEKLTLTAENGKYQGMLEVSDRERKEKDERIAVAEQKLADQGEVIHQQELTLATKEQRIADLEEKTSEQREELESYHKTIFGLFRKKK